MAQIAIPDALYQRLRAIAQQQGVPVETLVRATLEGLDSTVALLSAQEEHQLFAQLDQLAHQNGQISSEDWGKIVSDLRD